MTNLRGRQEEKMQLSNYQTIQISNEEDKRKIFNQFSAIMLTLAHPQPRYHANARINRHLAWIHQQW